MERKTSHLFSDISKTMYKKILDMYNIKYIMVNEDLVPRYGFVQRKSTTKLKKIFGDLMSLKILSTITLCENQDNLRV